MSVITQRGSVLTAADAAGFDYYGSAVAVSDDGSVLAVGAREWEGPVSNQGGVYIYDWSGSAWVQRGDVIEASDAVATDRFGTSVALSADGSVLAVGAPNREHSSLPDPGVVYIYDWTGSAWVQRGSAIWAPDAGASDLFGTSVALSDDAAVLAVGATQWDASASNQGGVYMYDWSGSAWVQRGSVIVASDAAASDFYGSAVALSGDATVLAVGAKAWEGPVSNQGGVYIYDWSGSAWVQRGSVIAAADAGSADWFGAAVALTGNAGVLAVGAANWEGSLTDQGGVYLFDWSGSAWVQRGSVLEASDAGGTDLFGTGVALSDDGSVMVVGAPQWDGAGSNQGAVYVYDVVNPTGTALAPTALTVEPSTGTASAATDLQMQAEGTATAPTEMTMEASTGTASAATDLQMYSEGAADAPTALTVELAQGVATAPTALDMQASTGIAAAPTALDMQASTGPATAPTVLTVNWPTGIPSAPTALSVTASGTLTAPTALAVLAPGHVPNWTARCLIDGVDVSAQLVGEASVTAEEGAARVARMVLQPPSGTIAPLDYVGRTIVLDYVLVSGGISVPRRLFTGRIDTPRYDPSTTLLVLDCTDDLQNRVAMLTRPVIAGLVGGRYTEAVQGELLDNWDYAKARLSTVAASLDAGPSGELRVTPWQLSTTWATYGESSLLYQQCTLTLPQRSTLVNKVDVAFDYRYPRLRQRFTWVGWSGDQATMLRTGYSYPTQQDILAAAGGSGWQVVRGVFWPAPAAIPHSSGGFIYPAEGSIDMAIVELTQRHSQTVTENYAITVQAPESIAANGELPRAIRGALKSEFQGQAWEAALDVAPLMPTGGETDWAPDAPRGQSDYAIQTLLDQANVLILGSHRSARIGNTVLCNPDLDLNKRIVIDTPAAQAAGKVASVTHRLDFDRGSALTDFDLAIFGIGGAGIITPDTLAPPGAPDAATEQQQWWHETPSLQTNVYGQTPYQTGLMGLLLNPPETITVENVPDEGTVTYPNPFYVPGSYPVTGFRVAMPGVDDADRNPLVSTSTRSYQLVIPEDTLAFTIP